MKTLTKASAIILVCLLVLSFAMPAAAYDAPQRYSTETVGEIPEIAVPDPPTEQDGILVFLNKTELVLRTKPYLEAATVFVPLEEIFTTLGLNVTKVGSDYEIDNKSVADKTADVTAVFPRNGSKGTVNGKEVELSDTIKTNRGVVMAPADIIALVTNEKVWFDPYSNTLVITTGAKKTDDILKIINYKFWMNGEPFYELSFNKFDLCYQISSKYQRDAEWPKEEHQLPAAEEALAQLHELGFRTIRVFTYSRIRQKYVTSEKQRERYYELMDVFFDLCDKYEIQVVVCLGLTCDDFSPKGENRFDLICNPESESRKNCYDFIDRFVSTYKNRRSVLMWEIVNEGNLDADVGINTKGVRASAYQIGKYNSDIAKRIKQNDPDRLVTTGDSGLRSAQWHLYKGVKEGKDVPDWTRDTLEERLKIYTMLNENIDVISVHTYSLGANPDETYRVSDTDDRVRREDFSLLMEEARRMGKVLYNGETAVDADNYSESVYQRSLKYIDSIIEAGVQLSHWWTFHTDRQGFNDGYGWDITSGELLDAIIAGNKKLNETYVLNGVSVKTEGVWADNAEAKIITGSADAPKGVVSEIKDFARGCGSVIAGTQIAAVVLAAAVVLRKKRK